MPTAEILGVESVLEVVQNVYGIDGKIKRGKNEFTFLCPVHADSHPSADVNLETGYWSCFSCKAGGDLAGLGKDILGRSRNEVLKLIKPNEPSAITASISRRVRAAQRDYLASTVSERKKHKGNADDATIASYSDGPFDYMHDRGFTPETLERWGVRYCNEAVLDRPGDDPFTITNAIAIPICRPDGETFAYCYRATEDSARWFREARFIYTPDAQLDETWGGLQLHEEGDEITVTEGFIDAMWCDQNGYPAIPIMGSSPKVQKKIRKLADWRRVRLFLDNDNAGHITTWQLGEALTDMGVPVTVVLRKPWMVRRDGRPAKDANDLCRTDLELVCERAVPFIYWKHRANAAA
jgi:DNA primase